MNRLIESTKRIRIRDICSPMIFVALIIPSLVLRLANLIKGRKLWLVAEDGEARDNGYHFYKYIRTNHAKDYCFYAVKKSSSSYAKVKKLGNIVEWGSLRHWLLYMSANLNISSQKGGNPCPIFWYVVHVTLGLYKNRVFLQHGITKDDSEWLYYKNTKFKYFVCGAKREYDYILKRFGYEQDSLLLTGFPRWDNLKDVSKTEKQKAILVMPTWRNWLGGERNKLFESDNIKSTCFYKNWSSLLNNKVFIDYLEKNNILVYFFPHINMMNYINDFQAISKNIIIVTKEIDMQHLFNKCSLMLTDYSSVAFDFAYLGKPVVYYQFDYEEYRKRQYREGYFSYRNDGFGPIAYTEDEVLDAIISIGKHEAEYEKRFDSFFLVKKSENCKRLYEALIRGKK